MKVIVHAPDGLVFRDGKPFGDPGVIRGGFHDWPMPQTLAGMARTAVGFARSPDYFKNKDNIQEILKLTVGPSLPLDLSGKHPQPLWPVPADLFLRDSSQKGILNISTPCLNPLEEDEGISSPFDHPVFPIWPGEGKPAKMRPRWLQHDKLLLWCTEGLHGDVPNKDLGPEAPFARTSNHNAIDRNSGASQTGILFQVKNQYLAAPRDSSCVQLGIGLSLGKLKEGETLPTLAFLGAERRQVILEPAEKSVFPKYPDLFADQRYLKLMLVTHGDFGDWLPEWLQPCLDRQWVEAPGSGVRVILRHAFVPGWDGVSGWDYAARGPKAMRKLVPPGSVYVLEMADPNQSAEFARSFSLQPIEPGTQASCDGFNYVLPGCASRMCAELPASSS